MNDEMTYMVVLGIMCVISLGGCYGLIDLVILHIKLCMYMHLHHHL